MTPLGLRRYADQACFIDAEARELLFECSYEIEGLRAALGALLNACIQEFGWIPDGPDDEKVTDDPDCLITWGVLRQAHRALESAAPAEHSSDADSEGVALSAAAAVFADHGIEFSLPWEGTLDDLERERFDALAAACKAYAALAPVSP